MPTANVRNTAHQDLLLEHIKSIFVGENILVNARKNTALVSPLSSSYMEMDVWLPDFKLGFEFQDEYHYKTTWYNQNSHNKVQLQDYIKKNTMRQKGVWLVVIPCWWDGSVGSLISTIHFLRPELFVVQDVPPIELNPPFRYFNTVEIPEIGELMLASFPNEQSFSISWWLGEKYDGIRCCWQPTLRKLYARSGRRLALTKGFAKNFPAIFMDGEAWFGRGSYSNAAIFIAGAVEFVLWHMLKIISFDNPVQTYSQDPFELRYGTLLRSIPISHSFVIIATRVLCESSTHMSSMVQRIIDFGGEGAILRQLGSPYERGRTQFLVKLKAAYGDSEAMVLGVNRNTIQLKLPNKTVFLVPVENLMIPMPKKGEIVSFTYDTFARRDAPVNPKIYRVRTDISWEEVLRSSKEKQLNDQALVAEFKEKKMGQWTMKDMRLFLEQFAKEKGFDPLLPSTWNNFTSRDILPLKGGRKVLKKLKGYYNAVRTLFFDVKFTGLDIQQRNWFEQTKRRKLFETYAKENNFDPLIPENWYSQPIAKIMKMEGAKAVVSYHNFSVRRALSDLFPDINFDRSKFQLLAPVSQEGKRKFFENYAWEHSFDPLLAGNWYQQPRDTIALTKGANAILNSYQGDVTKALLDIFPDINLDISKFTALPSCTDVTVRRDFFEKFAKQAKFDPLSAKGWYLQSIETIMASEGAKDVMYYHHNSVAQALFDLFPEIGIDKSQFLPQANWSDVQSRRKFFTAYAASQNFDPLTAENWYSAKEHLMSATETKYILSFHDNSLSRALHDLFPEVRIDRARFLKPALWKEKENRRKFFENYAERNGFDPLVAHNWSLISNKHFMATKGATRVLQYHLNSLSKALIELFPEIDLDSAKLKGVWKEKSRREFFETYAKKRGFDPLEPENWYTEPLEQIMETKGAHGVVLHYHQNVKTALITLFPEIGLKRSKFKSDWDSAANRKKYFLDFARSRNFDPGDANAWYLHATSILAQQDIKRVLFHHNNSLSKALSDLFPKIGINSKNL